MAAQFTSCPVLSHFLLIGAPDVLSLTCESVLAIVHLFLQREVLSQDQGQQEVSIQKLFGEFRRLLPSISIK